MKFKNVLKILSISTIAFVMVGCGSGSDDGSIPTPPDNPVQPELIDYGYAARDLAIAGYQIKGNDLYFATDNRCVYPKFIHTDFYYEIYDNNTAMILYDKSYDPSKTVTYNCNVTGSRPI